MKTRLKRDDPERLDPIRSWDTLFRPAEGVEEPAGGDEADSRPASSAGENASGDSSLQDIASRAIERGYEVIEEQIRQGQRIAERLTGYSGDVQQINNDAARLMERSLRFYTDVGYLWFELVESLLRSTTLATSPLQRREGDGIGRGADSPSGSEPAAGRQDVEIEVTSRSTTSVTLDLKGRPTKTLLVQPLRSVDEKKPPLTQVKFESSRGAPVLRIKVPPNQPPDTYTGVILDASSGQPRGTVCVRIRDAEPVN